MLCFLAQRLDFYFSYLVFYQVLAIDFEYFEINFYFF